MARHQATKQLVYLEIARDDEYYIEGDFKYNEDVYRSLPVREVSEEMRQEFDRQIVSKEELQAIYEEVKCAICQGVPEEVGVNRHCLHAMCK